MMNTVMCAHTKTLDTWTTHIEIIKTFVSVLKILDLLVEIILSYYYNLFYNFTYYCDIKVRKSIDFLL